MGASLSEQCITDDVMAHCKPWITAEFVTVCCSMSVGSKILRAAISSVNEATEATHTLSLNFTLELSGEFLVLMSVDYAWTYLKRTQLYLCVICNVCEQPALVCHGPQLPCVG